MNRVMKTLIASSLVPVFLVLATLTASAGVARAMAMDERVAVPAGVDIRGDAKVFYGSSASTTQPATLDYGKVKKKTPEWKKIQSEGVRPGSARYQLLIADMHARLRRICKKVAPAEGCDFVVDEDGLDDANGLPVSDLTDAVIDEL